MVSSTAFGSGKATAVLVKTESLQRHYRVGDQTVQALDGVDATIAAGEFLAVTGPSGSGKSTLLYLLGGLDHPTDGHIWVRGHEISTLDEHALADYRVREIGFVFQSFHLIPTMTALENVMLPMMFVRRPAEERRARAEELLAQVGLADRVRHTPTELSGGQQQRVAVARALANDPAIVLADEPTGNLDSHVGAEVMNLLVHLNREEGRTVVVVTHDPSVSACATRTLRLRDGRVDYGGEIL